MPTYALNVNVCMFPTYMSGQVRPCHHCKTQAFIKPVKIRGIGATAGSVDYVTSCEFFHINNNRPSTTLWPEGIVFLKKLWRYEWHWMIYVNHKILMELYRYFISNGFSVKGCAADCQRPLQNDPCVREPIMYHNLFKIHCSLQLSVSLDWSIKLPYRL